MITISHERADGLSERSPETIMQIVAASAAVAKKTREHAALRRAADAPSPIVATQH